ncbi:M20/M25/M40 family metallo-hydrolase [Zunongwangia endophytica]|uniref:Carboxypeptidase Q n=1 Tax=Zunongwangia endophytica TaxID=1808945 RepID=A0ABV8HBM0_9FLAO|nr:M20/M25/M40 family metallo-hydrolase [Zunongwangia endophytica]MDN3594922.1 M20/M25/M40 family metallo-hydrolase [Zunongwangia endophytica]
MKRFPLLILLLAVLPVFAQSSLEKDEAKIKEIYDMALTNGQSYNWLGHLSNTIGGRLSGSYNAQRAVDYTKKELDSLGLDRVWLQEVMVPKWTRGFREYAYIETIPGSSMPINICALGGSVATPDGGTKAEVIEVKDLEELEKLGEAKIKGKIVFFNRPMDATKINTFSAYGGAVDQRANGAAEASKFGAVGVLVRSMNLKIDEYPHAGSMYYGDIPEEQKIPAAAISTKDAEYLSGNLKLQKDLKVYFKMNCENHPDVKSYNVIGEITGSEYPDEYIVVGGHLDSWDLGDGSHDDGAGCVQSMEVLRLFKELNYKPKRSIRVVLFMNEENGLRGGKKYAEVAKDKNENHVFALESDSGGFTPRGFTFNANENQLQKLKIWASLFKPYYLHIFKEGEGGADIGPLEGSGTVLAGLQPDSQRYFDYHHAATDTFDKVSKRELELGGASMAALIYLVDKYGL